MSAVFLENLSKHEVEGTAEESGQVKVSLVYLRKKKINGDDVEKNYAWT